MYILDSEVTVVTPVVIVLEFEVKTVVEISVVAVVDALLLEGAELDLGELDDFDEPAGFELDVVEPEDEGHTLLTIFFTFFAIPKISLKLEISHLITLSIELRNNLTTLHLKSLTRINSFLILVEASPTNLIVSPRLSAFFFNSSSKKTDTEEIPLKSFDPITWINAEI